MSAWQQFKDVVDNFISRESPQPPFAGPIAVAADDSLVAGQRFVPEASYFSVKLVEMRLAEGGRYFSEFLPLGICVAEYTYGTDRRRVPLVLSNETVRQMLGDAGGQPGRVYFSNMPIVRRTPVKQDNLALFVGLFRMPYSDIARSVLQLAADVSEELGGAVVGAGAKVAAKLYDRIADVFSLNTVQPRFAFLNGTTLVDSGYLLVAGSLPAGVKADDLLVKNGRLRLKADVNAALPAGFDYCLLAIEHCDSLFSQVAPKSGSGMLASLAGLPFHQRWRGVSSLLAQNKASEADQALLMLRSEVIVSPDLTEEDRLTAIGGYDLAFAQYQDILNARTASADRAAAFRSAVPVAGLKAEVASRKQRGDTVTADLLQTIAVQLQKGKRLGEQSPQKDPDDLLADAFSNLRPVMALAHRKGAQAAILANALSVGASRVD
jgi:hypothetical protein